MSSRFKGPCSAFFNISALDLGGGLDETYEYSLFGPFEVRLLSQAPPQALNTKPRSFVQAAARGQLEAFRCHPPLTSLHQGVLG